MEVVIGPKLVRGGGGESCKTKHGVVESTSGGSQTRGMSKVYPGIFGSV